MSTINLTKQKGIALIQVLLISAIISILAIHFSYTARDQIAIAASLEQRVKATQLLKSAQSKIIYRLLTEHDFSSPSDIFPNSEPWNFYNNAFVVQQSENSKITVAIQDNNGLLSQHYIGSPFWTRVLTNIGFTDSEVKAKQRVIKDWQDKDSNSEILGDRESEQLDNGLNYRNQAIQLPQEIEWFFQQEPEKLNTIKQISTHYALVGFNPMHAPEALLRLYFQSDIAEVIIRQREDGSLTRQQMISILGTDYDDVLMSLFLGTQFKIATQVRFGDVTLQETLEVKIQPSESTPVLILARY
jgi:general secretion pathway protein K